MLRWHHAWIDPPHPPFPPRVCRQGSCLMVDPYDSGLYKGLSYALRTELSIILHSSFCYILPLPLPLPLHYTDTSAILSKWPPRSPLTSSALLCATSPSTGLNKQRAPRASSPDLVWSQLLCFLLFLRLWRVPAKRVWAIPTTTGELHRICWRI